MVPLGMYQMVPLVSRTLVMRSVMSSTVPVATPASMRSPTPYWSSTSMKMPERKSLTRLWAPKPRATPAMPAPAMSGPRATPSSPRIMMTAIVQMTVVAIERRTRPRVWARAAARRDIEPVVRRALGVWFRSVPRVPLAPESTILLVRRLMLRRTSRLAMAATTTMSRMWRGGTRNRSDASAHASLPVHWKTWRHTSDGSVPQACWISSTV
jgi:hypothetical protein